MGIFKTVRDLKNEKTHTHRFGFTMISLSNRPRLEMLVTSLMLGAILFPVRLLIVRIVGNDWYGSLGILTAITILLYILAKKNKLSFFGPMYIRFLMRLHGGKRRVIVYSVTSLMLIISASVIYAINEGDQNPYWRDKIITMVETGSGRITSNELPTDRELITAVMAVTNHISDGWYLHFWTVLFIEEVEVTVLLIITKIITIKKHRVTKMLDARGLFCPEPVFRTKIEVERMQVGEMLTVLADDPNAEEDVTIWVKRNGHELLSLQKKDSALEFQIKKVK